MGEHLVVKDYNIKILEINNQFFFLMVKWATFKKLLMDLYGMSICQK